MGPQRRVPGEASPVRASSAHLPPRGIPAIPHGSNKDITGKLWAVSQERGADTLRQHLVVGVTLRLTVLAQGQDLGGSSWLTGSGWGLLRAMGPEGLGTERVHT